MKNSGYKTRIEKALASLHVDNAGAAAILRLRKMHIPLTDDGKIPVISDVSDEFEFVKFYYATGKKDCDLCNHRNIKRVFVIRSKVSGREAHIGSECAKNYLEADIVEGLSKVFNIEYLKIVNPIKFEREIEALKFGIENNIILPWAFRQRLINGGSPLSVLKKIKNGKPITKKEKEVLDIWMKIYENGGIVKFILIVTDFWRKVKNEVVKERWEKERKRRYEEEVRLARLRSAQLSFRKVASIYIEIFTKNEFARVSERVFRAKEYSYLLKDRGDKMFISRLANKIARTRTVPDFDRERLERINDKLFGTNYADNSFKGAGTNVAAKADEIPVRDLFSFIYENKLESPFVNSVYSYFKRNGFVTSKQKAVLVKIAKRGGFLEAA